MNDISFLKPISLLMGRVALIAVVVLVVLFITPTLVTPATFPGSNGSVAFSYDDSGTAKIATANLDGTGFTILATGGDNGLSWSPDGTKIVYAKSVSGQFELWVMSADGSDQHKLTSPQTGNQLHPSWSPDGNSIVFHATIFPLTRNDLYVVSASGGTPVNITNTPTIAEEEPEYSPSGNLIVYRRINSAPPSQAIYTITPDGSTSTAITAGGFDDFLPYWSPDGNSITFTSNRSGSYQIWLMDSDGSNLQQLTNIGGSFTYWGTFTPDGTQIIFYDDNEPGNLMTIAPVAGSTPTRLSLASNGNQAVVAPLNSPTRIDPPSLLSFTG